MTVTATGHFGTAAAALQTLVSSSATFIAAQLNLVTDGGFDDPTKWTAGDDWAVAGGVATYTEASSPSPANRISQSVDIVAGRSYVLTFTVTNITGTSMQVALNLGGALAGYQATTGTFTKTIVAGSTNTLLTFGCDGDNGGTITIDNVSIKEVYSNSGTDDIDETDRVVITSGRFAGTYEILGIEDMGGRERYLQLDLDLIPGTN